MSDSKHTPGPWKLRGAGPSSARHIISQDESTSIGGAYCGPTPETDIQNWRQPCISESEANARLIAAAPELLAACEAARGALVLLTMIDKTTTADKAYRVCVSAIAKATGQEEQS